MGAVQVTTLQVSISDLNFCDMSCFWLIEKQMCGHILDHLQRFYCACWQSFPNDVTVIMVG